MNKEAQAIRNATSAVKVKVVSGKTRSLSTRIAKSIDLRLSRIQFYKKLDLNPFLGSLQCWERYKVLKDIEKGLPSGTIEMWSWMPGGGRAGIAAHVVWKVGLPLTTVEFEMSQIVMF